MGEVARKLLVVSSSGGVLLDMLALREWYARHEVVWVAVHAPDTDELLRDDRVHWVPECSRTSPRSLARGFAVARRLLASERPDVVLSAGTGIAVPFFVAAKLQRVASVWVDTFNVVDRPGNAARLCSRLASMTLVQRQHLVGRRPRATFIGELY